MKAVSLEAPRELRLTECVPPVIKPGEALLRTRVAGICGSDLGAFRGTNPLVRYPCIPGHEVCAEVLEVGDNDRGLSAGDRVCVEPLLSCGRCAACRRGKYNCCSQLQVLGVHTPGAMREVFAHPVSRLHRPPAQLTDDQVALCEPLTIGYHANQRAWVGPDQQVLILGAGTIGLCALAVALTRTPHVMVVDRLPSRLEVAVHLGAERAVAADQQDVQAAVHDWTDGQGVQAVIEAVGSAATWEAALDLVAFGGRVAILGWCQPPVEFHRSPLFIQKEVDFVGSRTSRNAFPPVLHLLASGRVNLDPLITHRFPLTQAAEAFRLLDEQPETALKCLLTLNG